MCWQKQKLFSSAVSQWHEQSLVRLGLRRAEDEKLRWCIHHTLTPVEQRHLKEPDVFRVTKLPVKCQTGFEQHMFFVLAKLLIHFIRKKGKILLFVFTICSHCGSLLWKKVTCCFFVTVCKIYSYFLSKKFWVKNPFLSEYQLCNSVNKSCL